MDKKGEKKTTKDRVLDMGQKKNKAAGKRRL